MSLKVHILHNYHKQQVQVMIQKQIVVNIIT
jgi:hypothetical protein